MRYTRYWWVRHSWRRGRVNLMTKLVTNIDINSVTLETRHDENTGNILNQAFVSTSFITTSKQSLKFTSLRLIVSLSRESSRPIDFITQRYNEFKDLSLEDISSQQYNRFLQGALGKQEDYLRSSSPFSPLARCYFRSLSLGLAFPPLISLPRRH